ncbi:MAG: tetratricopeptide repeat protein [Saprospiraceae bacterium]
MKPIFQEHRCLSEGDIQDYLGNRLSGEERHRVENHLLDCPLCSDALEGLALLEEDRQELKAPSRVRRMPWRFFAVAAAILALMVAVVWVYSGISPSGRLYAEFYETYKHDLSVQMRNGGNARAPEKQQLSGGLEAYISQYYSESIALLQPFVEDNPNHLVARYYLGLSYMEEKKWAEAETQLTAVQSAHLEYWEESTWYLALLYIKTDRKDEAREALQSLISARSGRYNEKARKLLSKL